MALLNQEGMKNKAKKISDIIPKPELGSDRRPERNNCKGKLGDRIAVPKDAVIC
jgi:hypothetical protein